MSRYDLNNGLAFSVPLPFGPNVGLGLTSLPLNLIGLIITYVRYTRLCCDKSDKNSTDLCPRLTMWPTLLEYVGLRGCCITWQCPNFIAT